MPPAENPTYIRVDDNSFYLAKTTSEYFTIDGLQGEIDAHKASIASIQKALDDRVALLQGAVDVQVANASPLLDAASGISTQLTVATEPSVDATPAPMSL